MWVEVAVEDGEREARRTDRWPCLGGEEIGEEGGEFGASDSPFSLGITHHHHHNHHHTGSEGEGDFSLDVACE